MCSVTWKSCSGAAPLPRSARVQSVSEMLACSTAATEPWTVFDLKPEYVAIAVPRIREDAGECKNGGAVGSARSSLYGPGRAPLVRVVLDVKE
jgi:hypothetical protein